MAEGDITLYNKFKFEILNGTYALANAGDTVQITLHTGYTPNIDTHQLWGDVGVSSTEYGTASGYTANGKVLANQATALNTATDRGEFDADSVTWSALGPLTPATPSHAIIWDNTPTVPADPLICYIELGVTATNGGDYTIAFSASPSAILYIG